MKSSERIISSAIARLFSCVKKSLVSLRKSDERNSLLKAAMSLLLILTLLFSVSAEGISSARAADIYAQDGLLEQSFELYPNGRDSDEIINLNGLMPVDAEPKVVDVTFGLVPTKPPTEPQTHPVSTLTATESTLSGHQPQTGDDTKMEMYLLIAMIASAGLFMLAVMYTVDTNKLCKKKKKRA